MKTDALSRRKRTVSQAVGHGVVVTPPKIRLLNALRRHGPLPAHLLTGFWHEDRPGNLPYVQFILTKLFHETMGGGPYVTRPPELNPQFVNHEPAWYDLTSAGFRIAQAESDIVLPKKKDWMAHRAMGATLGATFELLAPAYGLEFRHLENLLAHKQCPPSTRDLSNALAIPLRKGSLEPDGFFGLKYPESKFRFFFREDDRSTERATSSNPNQTSLKDKIAKYDEMFARGLHKAQFGIGNASVLFITTTHGRIDTMRGLLKESPYANRWLFKVLPNFGVQWRAPRAPIAELYEPWMTVDGTEDISRL